MGPNSCFRFVDRDMYMRYRGDGIGHLDPLTRRSLSNTGEGRPATLASLNEESMSDILEDEFAGEDGSSRTSSDSDSMGSTDSPEDIGENSASEEANETSEEEA